MEEEIDGVKVLKICRKDAGCPGLRFFHPKWTRLNDALRKADADVYYHNCGECVTGQIALWCQKHRKPFVFSSASEGDCEYPHRGLSSQREQMLFCYGIRRAKVRVVQTQKQKRMLEENLGLSSIHIPMPCQELSIPPALRNAAPSNRVVWVGRIWIEKRPEMFLDLAEACPSLHFDLVGPGFNAEDYGHSFSDDVFSRARRISNVTVHGALTREQVFCLYDEAACLCCTSEYEGFPNTFLEAWSRGVPVVSTFDPDNTIVSRNLGAFARNAAELKLGLLSVLGKDETYKEISSNALRYFAEHHTVDAVLPRFAEVFSESVCSAIAQ